MTDSKLIDSSVWLAYLFNGQSADLIDSEEILLLSSLSLFEIKKKLKKSGMSLLKMSRSMEFIKKRSLVLPVTSEIAEQAIEVAVTRSLPAVDALIYTTSQVNQATLFTYDNDFRGLKDVVICT